MNEPTGELPKRPEALPRVQVMGTLGMGETLLKDPQEFKKMNTWFPITTSKKTYPDEMILEFAKWGTEHSNRTMVIIADGMQVFNKFAIKGINPFDMTEEQTREYDKEVKEYQREARKRARELKALLKDKNIKPVRVRLWSELLETMAARDWKDRFVVEGFREMFYGSDMDVKFEADMKRIVEERAGHILDRSIGDRETSEFVAGLYPREQLVLTQVLATLGVYNYLVKIGPEAERIYDEVALDICRNGFGTFRGVGEPNETWTNGAVYLRPTTKQEELAVV